VGLVGLRVNTKILAAQRMVNHPSSFFIFADKNNNELRADLTLLQQHFYKRK